MQEVLSRSNDPKVPLRDQEFYELRLDDPDAILGPEYIVHEARATWSEVDGQIMWDEIETERCPTLEKAQERYAARRVALAQRGFIHSDMDLI